MNDKYFSEFKIPNEKVTSDYVANIIGKIINAIQCAGKDDMKFALKVNKDILNTNIQIEMQYDVENEKANKAIFNLMTIKIPPLPNYNVYKSELNINSISKFLEMLADYDHKTYNDIFLSDEIKSISKYNDITNMVESLCNIYHNRLKGEM
jgi:hypothetical protein